MARANLRSKPSKKSGIAASAGIAALAVLMSLLALAAAPVFGALSAGSQAVAASQALSTPRPAAAPVLLSVEGTPTPQPTTPPMTSKLVRDELEKSLASDIEPTPSTPSRGVRLTPAQAAQKAVDAAQPSIKAIELQRTVARRQFISLQRSIEAARAALEMDDRYRLLVEEEDNYGLEMDEMMMMELLMYKEAGYEELDPDTRRQLIQARDQGADSFNLNITKLNYAVETTERGIAYSAYAQYAAIAKLQAAIALSQESLDSQAAELEKTRRKYELGLAARMDVENAEASYKKNALSHGKTKRQLQALVTSFNSLLGQNLETTYADFDVGALAPDTRVHALAYFLDGALAERSEILLQKESLRLAERQLELFDDEPYKFSSIDDKRDAEQSAQEMQIDYDNALMDVEFEIRAAYKENQELRGKLQYYEEQIEAAEQNLERTQKLYELGSALQSSVDAVRMSLTQAKIQLSNAKIDIWLQERKLATISGIGPGGL